MGDTAKDRLQYLIKVAAPDWALRSLLLEVLDYITELESEKAQLEEALVALNESVTRIKKVFKSILLHHPEVEPYAD